MTTAKVNLNHVKVNDVYEVKYERRSALFGLIEWYVRVKEDRIGSEMMIVSLEMPQTIYLQVGDQIFTLKPEKK